jgi:ribosomal protein S18 acetylase RimI-like enzyme
VTGFVLLTVAENDRIAEVALNAVRPDSQRGGVYSALMRAAADYLVALGSVDRLFISTQRENQAVIAAWQKLGLEPFLTLETYHIMRRSG